MPSYNFRDNETGEEFTVFLKMAEREAYMQEHNCTQIPTLPALHSGRGRGKPDEGFRDILREMKKKHSKGFSRSTVNTF